MATYFDKILPGLQQMQNLKAQKMEMADYEANKKTAEEASMSLRDYYKTGNQDSLISATLKSPQLAGQVLQSVGLDNKQKQQQAAQDVAELWQLSDNPEQFKMKALQRVESVMQRGGNPSDTIALLQAYDKDPEQAKTMLRSIGAGLEAGGFSTGIFANAPERMTPFQQASIDLRKQELELNKQQKQLDTQLKVLEAQMRKEDNDLKKQDLQLKIEDQKQKIVDAEKQRQTASNEKVAGLESARSNLDNMLNTLARVESTPLDTFEAATGPIDQRLPTLSQDTADFEELVGTLGSQAFLSQIPLIKGMGQLSNAEGEKLQSALQNFSLRQSPERLKENLAEARRLLTKARANIAKQYGAEETKPDTPAAGSASPKFKIIEVR